MSDRIVPNLADLLEALPQGSAGAQVAAAFEAPSVEAARAQLRAVVEAWEAEPDAEPSEGAS